jgi:hypothetical protein
LSLATPHDPTKIPTGHVPGWAVQKCRLKVYLDLKDEKYSLRQMVIVADQVGHDGMTTEKILAALDKPRKLYSILMVVNPSGSLEELQQKLLKMRDEGLVKFDIHKGRWSRET